MKHKKKLGVFMALITVGAIVLLGFIIFQQNEAASESKNISQDRITYIEKKYECSGTAKTNISYVNSAGLTNCGGDLATQSLHFKTLYDIYHTYCGRGFGVAVFGCAYTQNKTVYVCIPGTTLYDRRNTYVSYYYIRYQYISYACDDLDPKNTIRHELLHLVYSDLSTSDQARVSAKLSSYEPEYASQLSGYSSYERGDELFVRVGADGRKVDDIELVDLYSKVTSAYTEQKQRYYGSLVSETDKYIKKYEDLSNGYSVLIVITIMLVVADVCYLFYISSALKKMDDHNLKNRSRQTVKEASRDFEKMMSRAPSSDHFDFEDAELYDLKRQIDEMGKEPKRDTKKEFEEFKKKYGIIDIDED